MNAISEAMDRHRRGDLVGAKRYYQEHLDRCPEDAEALCLLGALEGQGGNHEAAEEIYRRAIRSAPGHGPAHGGLGTSLLMQDRPAEACEALATAVALAPGQPEPRLHYTVALQRCGRLIDARQSLSDFVQRWPGHLQSRHNLGLLLLRTDSPDAAAEQFRFVLDREPSRSATWLALGRALMAANDPPGAEAALTEAIRLAPDDPDPRVLLGALLQGRGRRSEARATLEGALQVAPDHEAAIVALAELDLAAGHPERGLDRLVPLCDGPGCPPQAMIALVRVMAAVGRPEEAVGRIDGWISAGGVPPGMSAGLLSLKGRLLDDLGDYGAAWEAWAESLRLAPPQTGEQHFARAVERLVDAFAADVFDGRVAPEDTAAARRPLLIVGAPRSGKSILEQMLSCHPAIRGAGELRVLGALSDEIARRHGTRTRPYPECISALTDEDIGDLRRTYREVVGKHAGGAAWVADTQPTNFLHIGMAALIEPRLRVIYCRRDPLDTAWACLGRRFADPGLDFVATPEGTGTYLTGMGRVISHWERVIPMEILEVRYEDLVRSTRDTLMRIIDFLGLGWDESLLAYAEPGRPDIDSEPVLSGPLTDIEIGRGRPYEDRLAAVRRSLAEGKHGS